MGLQYNQLLTIGVYLLLSIDTIQIMIILFTMVFLSALVGGSAMTITFNIINVINAVHSNAEKVYDALPTSSSILLFKQDK